MITVGEYHEGEGIYPIKLIIDGEIVENAIVRYKDDDEKISASVKDEAVSRRIIKESYEELREKFSDLTLAVPVGQPDIFPDVTIAYQGRAGEKLEIIVANANPRLTNWSKPWSFVEYIKAFQEKLQARNDMEYALLPRDMARALRSYAFESIFLSNFDREVPLSTNIEKFSEFISEIHEETEKELTANLNRNSLVTFFDFPPTVRVACEQYLQYFIQFLEDLGIEADSQISSDAGRVLFSVTPRSDEEALETIRQALSAYLALPENNTMSQADMMSGGIALIQLNANVSHLQSQLSIAAGMAQLAQATIQAKDAKIYAQATEIAMYQRDQMMRTDGSELLRIEQPPAVPHQDSEPLGNFIKVVPLKIKGMEFDLPKLLRSLKRRFP